MLKVRLSHASAKQLSSLPPKHRRQVADKILQLKVEPRPPDSKPLRPPHSRWIRATAGEYRILYRVEEETLWVERIGKRNDAEVYRRLPSK